MQGDTALSEAARKLVLPHSRLEGDANILIMPNLDAANIAYQMIKVLADALPVGPILIGPRAAGAYPHAVGDGARHPQHDGGRRGRGPGARRPPAAHACSDRSGENNGRLRWRSTGAAELI